MDEGIETKQRYWRRAISHLYVKLVTRGLNVLQNIIREGILTAFRKQEGVVLLPSNSVWCEQLRDQPFSPDTPFPDKSWQLSAGAELGSGEDNTEKWKLQVHAAPRPFHASVNVPPRDCSGAQSHLCTLSNTREPKQIRLAA